MTAKCGWKDCTIDSEISIGDPHMMVALDRPYVNVFFHRDCYDAMLGEFGVDGVELYLAKNVEIWYNNNGKHRKNTRK